MKLKKNLFIVICLLLAVGLTGCKKDIKLRFVVISDVHMSRSAYSHEALTRVLKNLLEKKPLPDAIFVCGDFTENGWIGEYDAFNTIFADRSIVPEGVEVYLMMGNHEHRKTCFVDDLQAETDCSPLAQKNFRLERLRSVERFTEMTGQPLHQYIDIKGYPFITISETEGDNLVGSIPDKDVMLNLYDENSLQFLAEKLADASRSYPGKPIFLFAHIGSTSTNFGTFPQDDGGQKLFPPLLEGYPQLVFFNGHSHFPIGDPRSIHQERYTSINAGSANGGTAITYYIPAPYIPNQSNSTCTEGLIVNVLSDGTVEIERWDAFRNEEMTPCWRLEPPFDGSRFAYANRNGLPAPVFGANATVTGNIIGSDLMVRFTKATDNEVVNHYYIELLEEDGTVLYAGNQYSLFYMNSQTPEIYAIRIRLSGDSSPVSLPPCKTFQIRVTAVDSYGNRSTPIMSERLAIPPSFLKEMEFHPYVDNS